MASEPLLHITYECPACGAEWYDAWPCACDDTCPECGERDVEPHDWTTAEVVDDGLFRGHFATLKASNKTPRTGNHDGNHA